MDKTFSLTVRQPIGKWLYDHGIPASRLTGFVVTSAPASKAPDAAAILNAANPPKPTSAITKHETFWHHLLRVLHLVKA
jgi:hypothetical protein